MYLSICSLKNNSASLRDIISCFLCFPNKTQEAQTNLKYKLQILFI